MSIDIKFYWWVPAEHSINFWKKKLHFHSFTSSTRVTSFTTASKGQRQMGNKFTFHNISFGNRHSFIKNLYNFYIYFMLCHFEIFFHFYFIYHSNVLLFVRKNFIIKTFGIKNSCIYDIKFSSVEFRNVKHFPKTKQTKREKHFHE